MYVLDFGEKIFFGPVAWIDKDNQSPFINRSKIVLIQ